MAARSPAICRSPPRRLGRLHASSPNRTSQHGPHGTGSCTQQLANWRQQIILHTSAPIQRQASGHATAVSKRRKILPSPFAACRSVCARPLQRFRDRDRPRTARMHPHEPPVESSCDGKCDASDKPIPAPLDPCVHLMSYSSVMPMHVPLVPCIHSMSYSSIAPRSSFSCRICRKRVRQTPHAPRAHSRRPPAPRPSNASFLHFFAHHVKYHATGLTSGPESRASSLGPPRIQPLSSRVEPPGQNGP